MTKEKEGGSSKAFKSALVTLERDSNLNSVAQAAFAMLTHTDSVLIKGSQKMNFIVSGTAYKNPEQLAGRLRQQLG